jgi:hypothetical protein
MDSIAAEYFLLIFGASLGAIQIAAAYGGLRGLCLLRNRALSCLGGLSALSGTFWWFFVSVDLKAPPPGVEGSQQLFLFLAGAIAALLATLVVSSAVNPRLRPPECEPDDDPPIVKGLEELRAGTFLQSVLQRFRGVRD